MSKLLLIKHSNSNHNPDQPPHEWGLTPEGIIRAKMLAQYVKPYQPPQLFCSPMIKARHTADLLAQELGGLPIIENANLAEHSRRSNAPYTTLEAFHDNLRRFFAHPDMLIFGDETANEARHRFSAGIAEVSEQVSDNQLIVVVAHGTVNTLFTAQHNAIDDYDLWLKLKLPSVIILDRPSFQIDHIIYDAGIASK